MLSGFTQAFIMGKNPAINILFQKYIILCMHIFLFIFIRLHKYLCNVNIFLQRITGYKFADCTEKDEKKSNQALLDCFLLRYKF